MPPFSISLRSGIPIYEQVIYAVTRAIVSGELQPGDPFPSVRALSQNLKINPNTSHKIVAALVERGLLVVRPGIGTIVATAPRATASVRQSVLDDEAERLVVEARRAGLSLQDVLSSIRAHWTRTTRRTG
jgi:DNA-binding transcriptional regulator YhcF (GntR family)